MKSIDEFELALLTMRCAAHFSVNWNYSFVALENFLWNRKFCKEELKFDPNPARTLCQFVDFVLSEKLQPLEGWGKNPHHRRVDRLLGQFYWGKAPREKPALSVSVFWPQHQKQPGQSETAEEEVSSQRHLPQVECRQVQQGRWDLCELQRPGVEAHLQLERSERGELPALRSAAHQEREPLALPTCSLHS
jgi:hypothetical protein